MHPGKRSLKFPFPLSVILSALLLQIAFVPPVSGEAAPPQGVPEGARYLSLAKVWVLDLHGTQKVWYENGARKAEGQFRSGQRQGQWTFWYENGKVRAEGPFRNNLREGLWKFYYKNGAIEEEGAYRENLKDGHWSRYYPGGKKENEGSYTKGAKEGPWINYYENGTVFYRGTYSHNQAQGQWEYYFENGSIFQKGEFSNDVRVGKWYICAFPTGPCDYQYYQHPNAPRSSGLPPPEEDVPQGNTDNPAELLDNLGKGSGSIPDHAAPLPGKQW